MGRDNPAAVAGEVPALYADLGGLRMALITGSVARGLADEASDLDVYLYWDHVGHEALAAERRLEALGAKRVVGLPTASGFFEKYRLDGQFVDVESVDIRSLEHAASALGDGGRAP